MAEVQSQFKCDACGQNFETKADLQDHTQKAHQKQQMGGSNPKQGQQQGQQGQQGQQQGQGGKTRTAGGGNPEEQSGA